MKKGTTKILSAAVCTVLALAALTGCGNSGGIRNLMDGVTTEPNQAGPGNFGQLPQDAGDSAAPGNDLPPGGTISLPSADAVTCTDFAVRLFQECTRSQGDGNILVSPLSVINALAMTANGARGETLKQMEELFGADLDSLCSYLHNYNKCLPTDQKYKLHSANSIWIRDDRSFTVQPDFLQTNAEWFNADVYMAPFDGSTLRDINKWVSENTDEMIPKILDEIPAATVMYLINALAFDAEWQSVYYDHQVREDVFTREDGTTQDTEMMYSTEYTYLQDTQAQGFVKYYHDAKYAFAALLPDEGVSLAEYTASLTGERLHELLSNPEKTAVDTAIPKFEAEYSTLLNDVLENLGMTDAFDPDAADLSGLGTSPGGNLFISRVIHKTYISVNEKGTKAGAATVVEVRCKSEMVADEKIKTVYLDQPFVYMIIDCEENLPIFIGTVADLEQ
ncbi:MAG: serpin family protein [Acetatifactor sp.]|nr:serpin family protein [Acetatifactor sp.]